MPIKPSFSFLKQKPAAQVKSSAAVGLKKDWEGMLSSPRSRYEDEGTWIYSYGDMITLLLMFFVLLYALSSPSKKQFDALKEVLKSEENNATAHAPVDVANIGGVTVDKLLKSSEEAGGEKNAQLVAAITLLMKNMDTNSLSQQEENAEVFKNLQERLSALQKIYTLEGSQKAKIEIYELSFNLSNIFSSKEGSEFSEEGKKNLDKLSKNLKAVVPAPFVEIQIHSPFLKPELATTDKKLRALKISSTQAVMVMNALVDLGISPATLSAAGYGTLRSDTPGRLMVKITRDREIVGADVPQGQG